MIKGIIFDLDGTVLNTIEDLKNSINLVLKDYGLEELNSEQVKYKVGTGFKNLMINCFPGNTNENIINAAVKAFEAYYSTNYAINTKPYEGILELIQSLKNEGILIGINSNKKDEYTKKLVSLNFKDIDLDYTYGKRDNYPIKPDPINNIDIIKKMGLKNEEVLYVGDSNIDVKTAQNSDLVMCAVTWGFRKKEELLELNPNYIVSKPSEILDLINKLNKKEN